MEIEMERLRRIVGPEASCRRTVDKVATCEKVVGTGRYPFHPYSQFEAKLSASISMQSDGSKSVSFQVWPGDFDREKLRMVWQEIVKAYGLSDADRETCEANKRCYVGDLFISFELEGGNSIKLSRADAF